jgi:hypothetical protein
MSRSIVDALKEALKAPRQALPSWIVDSDEFKQAIQERRAEKILFILASEGLEAE